MDSFTDSPNYVDDEKYIDDEDDYEPFYKTTRVLWYIIIILVILGIFLAILPYFI